jgi:hypothetical protein
VLACGRHGVAARSTVAAPAPAARHDLSATDSEHAWLMTSRLIITTRTRDESALYATVNGGHSWHRLKRSNK